MYACMRRYVSRMKVEKFPCNTDIDFVETFIYWFSCRFFKYSDYCHKKTKYLNKMFSIFFHFSSTPEILIFGITQILATAKKSKCLSKHSPTFQWIMHKGETEREKGIILLHIKTCFWSNFVCCCSVRGQKSEWPFVRGISIYVAVLETGESWLTKLYRLPYELRFCLLWSIVPAHSCSSLDLQKNSNATHRQFKYTQWTLPPYQISYESV